MIRLARRKIEELHGEDRAPKAGSDVSAGCSVARRQRLPGPTANHRDSAGATIDATFTFHFCLLQPKTRKAFNHYAFGKKSMTVALH